MKLEYASRNLDRPSGELPAYRRYSARQLLWRCLLAAGISAGVLGYAGFFIWHSAMAH